MLPRISLIKVLHPTSSQTRMEVPRKVPYISTINQLTTTSRTALVAARTIIKDSRFNLRQHLTKST